MTTGHTVGGDGSRLARARGQATVEVALVLPVVVCVLLAVIQVALVARSQMLVTHAAREAARQMAVDPDEGKAAAVARATPGLDPQRVSVDVGPRGPVGATVTVTVAYRTPTDVPLVGALFGEPELRATVVMRVETGPDGVDVGCDDEVVCRAAWPLPRPWPPTAEEPSILGS